MRRRKYGNVKTEVDGFKFDSLAEAALYRLLRLEQRAGRIRNLKPHPGTLFLTAARIQYRPDFSYTNAATEETEYAEYKGKSDQKWPIKKKLWKHYGERTLVVWGGSHKAIYPVETIVPSGEKK